MNNDAFLKGMGNDAARLNRKFGRPLIEIDFDVFENLCRIQCTLSEIAGCFSCSEDTIERRVKDEYGVTFAEVYKQFSAHGKMSLRRQQFEQAMKGNTALLIRLGEVYLGQSAKVEKPKDDEKDKDSSDDISSMSDEELEQATKDLENE